MLGKLTNWANKCYLGTLHGRTKSTQDPNVAQVPTAVTYSLQLEGKEEGAASKLRPRVVYLASGSLNHLRTKQGFGLKVFCWNPLLQEGPSLELKRLWTRGSSVSCRVQSHRVLRFGS